MEDKVMRSPIACAEWLAPQHDHLNPVVWSKDTVFSLEQLRSEVNRLYSRLYLLPAKRIALFLDDHFSFIVSLLACLHAGKIPVLLGHSKLSRIVLEQNYYDLLLCNQHIDDPIPYEVYAPNNIIDVIEGDLPALDPQQTLELFTSGSSGRPKKLIKTLKQMDDEASLLHTLLQTRLTSPYLSTSVSPAHLYGLTFTVWLPLALSIPIYQHRIIYSEQYAALPTDRHYIFITSPAFLKRIDDTLSSPPTSLVLSAGGKLDQSSVAQTQSWLNIGVDEIYGSSETGIMAHRYRDEDQSPWCCLPGVTFNSSPKGWSVSSPLLPEQTELALSDELSFVDDRHFHLIGRVSRLIKLEEKRISLDEIEHKILKLNGIIDVAVITVPLEARQRIAALIVLTPALTQQWSHQKIAIEQQWRKELRVYLEDIALPRYWKVVESIPCDAMNKREDSRLKELFFETL